MEEPQPEAKDQPVDAQNSPGTDNKATPPTEIKKKKFSFNFGFGKKQNPKPQSTPPSARSNQTIASSSQQTTLMKKTPPPKLVRSGKQKAVLNKNAAKRRLGLKGGERLPEELVHVTGNRVLIPSFDDFDRLKDITYPVKEPFQYVNLQERDGEVIYSVFEPQLTKREKAIHKKVITAYDLLVNVGTVLIDVEDRIKFLEDTYNEIIDIYNIKMSPVEYQRILYYIERDYVRYGKADALINDRFIEDISCNGPDNPVYVYHRFFESIRTNVIFGELELNNFILRLSQLSGRHISILQPIRDAALPDGSRVNMTLGKEVTKKGSTFTIRKFRSEPISPIEIVSLRTASTQMLAYLWLLVEYEQSFLISGGTATGKTTLLNAISMLIRPENKIVSVEDTPEINLAHPNWIQAVTRVGFGEQTGGSVSGISGLSGIGLKGKSAGDITLYDLLIAALRQRPDYIIVGEVRGEEAYTLFQAISVGHAAMGTVHAASMVELLARVESMPMNVPRVLVANLDIVIFLAAIRKGEEKVRRVREIVEILGIDQGTKELITNTVFRWDPISDQVEYLGRSFIVEKLSKSFGIPKESLDAEVMKRTQVLDDLKNRGVVNYKEVTEAVRQYYLEREAIAVEIINRKKGNGAKSSAEDQALNDL
ncbi:MAG TPA: type II/IV secretion system ATPase subunit [Nitrososphaerales archaeon]|nr:type II/IV secretion system ATPase subunit [Nitrososphaerales archaeon]